MSIYTEIPSYVYKHTNTITKQFYFGSRCYNIRLNLLPENDIKNYICSSEIKTEIKENREIWETEIIKLFYGENKREECFWFEQDLIKEFWGTPLLLNKQYKDSSTKQKVFLSNSVCKEETKIKISKSNTGKKRTEEAKQKMSLAKVGKPRSEEVRKQMSERRKGVKRSKECIEKTRLSKIGKSRSEETKQKISDTLTGRVHTETLRECPNCGWKMRGSNLTHHLPKCNKKFNKV